jgi:hypothetical protein
MANTAAPTPAIQQAQPGQTSSVYQFNKTTANPQDINTIVGGMVDRSPWRWWDQFVYPLGSPAVPVPSEVDFFQIAMNQVDPVTGVRKTKVNTNMTNSGQFTPPYCLVMSSFGFYIEQPALLADVNKFFSQCWYQLQILGKIFFEGRLWMAPGQYGYSGHGNAASTDSFIVNGLPAPGYGYRIGEYARYIPPLTNFSMKLFFPGTPPTLSAAFTLTCFLDGLSDNPVQ